MLAAIPLALGALLPLPQEPGEAEDPFSGAANAGLIINSGNNDSLNANFDANAKYEAGSLRVLADLKYAGVRQTAGTPPDAKTTTRLYAGNLAYNRFLDAEKSLYAYAKGGARRDVPNGLQIRESAGLGGGYTFRWDEGASELSVEGGPSYVWENNVGTRSEDSASGRLAAALDSKLDEAQNLALFGTGEYLISFDDTSDQSFTGEIGVRLTVSDPWFVQASVALAWDNTPAPGFIKSDVRYAISVGTTF